MIASPSLAPLAPSLLADLPAWQAAQRPEATALVFEGHSLSYGALAQRCDEAAARLWHDWGVRSGDRVAWLGLNHADQIVLLFALARLGAMLVPLNFRLAAPEWQAVLSNCRPHCLVHDDTWAQAARDLGAGQGVPVYPVQALGDVVPHRPPACPPGAATPQSPVLLVYTSGTTGLPKGAVHTQANLMANMRVASAVQHMVPTDTVLTVLPLFHVGGLCIQTLPALLAGARVMLHARFDAGATLATIARERPTLTVQVPATMKALQAHAQWASTDVSCLRAVWAGSSVLPEALVEGIEARGVPVCNVYGATETGPFSIALPPGRRAVGTGSCGWPAPGVEARLLDPQQGVGEVLLRAPNVVERYWPDIGALDAQGWFHTGDLASCASDGSYTIVGRARDMIISGGENIYPAEVENALTQHPAVAECAVLGMPDVTWGQAVVAVVVLHADALADDEALLGHLRERIARYKVPRRLVRLDALPKTALGKVQKAALIQALG